MKKYFLILIMFILLTCISCHNNNNVEIIYHLNGGTLENAVYTWDKKNDLKLEKPRLDGYNFLGWYLDENYNSSVLHVLEKNSYQNDDSKVINLYAKYTLDTLKSKQINVNNYNFNGQQITISIINECYNPYSDQYLFNDKILRQAQISEIESSYNCNIIFKYIPSYYLSSLGQGNLDYENDFKENNILLHYGELSSSFYELQRYNYYNNLFVPLNEFAENINELGENNTLLTVALDDLKQRYGVTTNEIPTFELLAYDEKLFSEISVESPQSLWEKGLWTIDKFEEYIKILNNSYTNEIVHRIDLGEFASKLLNYNGQALIDYKQKVSYFSNDKNIENLLNLKDIFSDSNVEWLKGFYETANSKDKKFGFVSINLIELYSYFNNSDLDLNKTYSFVPYPSDGFNYETHFNSSTYNCYFMLNNYNYHNNNLTKEMVYSLISDLSFAHQSNQNFDKNMLYNICDTEFEKEMINQFIDTKLSFDGKSVLKRSYTKDNNLSTINNIFNEIINNDVNENTIQLILENIELTIELSVWE